MSEEKESFAASQRESTGTKTQSVQAIRETWSTNGCYVWTTDDRSVIEDKGEQISFVHKAEGRKTT